MALVFVRAMREAARLDSTKKLDTLRSPRTDQISMLATNSSTSNAVLRTARADDLPGIEHLLTTSGLPTAGVAGALGGFVVAESAGAIVGTAALEICHNDALLRSVAVAPE